MTQEIRKLWKLCNPVNTQGHEIPSDNYYSYLHVWTWVLFYYVLQFESFNIRGYHRNSKIMEKLVKYYDNNFLIISWVQISPER